MLHFLYFENWRPVGDSCIACNSTVTCLFVFSVSAGVFILILIFIAILIRCWCKKKNQIDVEDEGGGKPNNLAREEHNKEENVAELAYGVSHVVDTNDNKTSHLLVSLPTNQTNTLNTDTTISDITLSNENISAWMIGLKLQTVYINIIMCTQQGDNLNLFISELLPYFS